MTARRDQLQALIAEIDNLLSLPSSQGDLEDHTTERRLLEQSRQQLMRLAQLQSHRETPEGQPGIHSSPTVSSSPTADEASSVLRQLLNEMQQMIQPLRTEISSLQQQKTTLSEEIKVLEQRRPEIQPNASIDLKHLEDLFQALAHRLERQLQEQVQISLHRLDAAAANSHLLTDPLGEPAEVPLTPTQRLAYLKRVQAQSDEVLMNLDQVLRAVFDSLYQSLQSYQDSLAQGLDKMHTLGEQGEMLFQMLINHLTQHLNQAPLYLHETAPEKSAAPSRDTDNQTADSQPAEPPHENSWNLDEVELDVDLDDEGDATFWEVNHDISQLPLTDELQLDAESTTSPSASEQSDASEATDLLSLLEQLNGGQNAAIEADSSIEIDDQISEIESLYQSLFGIEEESLAEESIAQASNPEPNRGIAGDAIPTTELMHSLSVREIQKLIEPDPQATTDSGQDVPHSTAEIPHSENDGTLDTFLGKATHQELIEAQDLPEVPEKITSLSELLPTADGGIRVALSSPESSPENSARASVEAAPDEDLLATDTAASSFQRLDLEIPADAVERLGADLSALETGSHTPTTHDSSSSEISTQAAGAWTSNPEAVDVEEVYESSPTQRDNAKSEQPSEGKSFANRSKAPALRGGSSDKTLPAQQSRPQENSYKDLFNELSSEASDAAAVGESGLTLNDLETDSGSQGQSPEFTASELPGSSESTPDVGHIIDNLNLDEPVNTDPAEDDLTQPVVPQSASSETTSLEGSYTVTEADSPGLSSLDEADSVDWEVEGTTASEESAPQPPRYFEADSPAVSFPVAGNEDRWYLGLDLGATSLSAVLFDQQQNQVHPLYWNDQGLSTLTAERCFRLPAVATITGSTDQPESKTISAIGSAALRVNWDDGGDSSADSHLLKNFKSLLRLGIPHQIAQKPGSPLLQWSDSIQVSLGVIQQSLEQLLASLGATSQPLQVGTKDLDAVTLGSALQHLRGVIFSYPANWPEVYSFNLREATLAAGLVSRPDQIYFIEDAIATVLSGLPDPAQVSQEVRSSRQPQTLYNCNWQGGTVVISAGALLTDIAVVNLPQQRSQLSHSDFSLQTLDYGGNDLDLDIVAHLLHGNERRQSSSGQSSSTQTKQWGWQSMLPELEQARWAELDLESLQMPRPAEPDSIHRQRLHQRLQASLLGQSALEAAQHLKVILQHQNQFTLELADQRWTIRRRELENRIVLPYIQRVNGGINRLLSQTSLSAQAVNQVICTGGTASFPAMARWLRQKFPNATIIQDTYPNDRAASCSRVSYGLVNLVRYPQLLDLPRHQYSDPFLLLEILRAFPDQPMPFNGILHLLRQRGINTDACETHIIALLEGRIPPGLIPISGPLVANDKAYDNLRDARLFSRSGGQIYVPNSEPINRFKDYMAEVLADKRQSLEEPLTAELITTTITP